MIVFTRGYMRGARVYVRVCVWCARVYVRVCMCACVCARVRVCSREGACVYL